MKVIGRSSKLFLLAFALLAAPRLGLSAQNWTKARSGAFETVTDDGKRSATQSLSQFEQFKYALGYVLGKPDLRLDPPVRILLFKNGAELAAENCAGLTEGRDRLNICAVTDGQLSPGTLRALTRHLLENNFTAMPAPVERALVSFFSTVESNGTRVTWGIPPAAEERTREWAMLHRIVTQPDYSGKARIYLRNLASGMDRPAAIRNALGEDARKFEADTDAYFQAGNFQSVPAPGKPINPDRDFSVTSLTADEATLMRADLLTPKSTERYRELIGLKKHVAESNEGLGLLAARKQDLAHAREYFQAALDAGSKNFVMMTAYAGMIEDTAKAIKVLRDAIAIDPKYAPARWLFGERTNDPRMTLFQWKKATELSPRNSLWWEKYAKLNQDRQQWAEAGRAWLAAAQSAPDEAHREQYLAARGSIDEKRLNGEDEIRRRELAQKTKELDDLKNQARKEIADLEARVNKNGISSKDAVFDWAEVNGTTVDGQLEKVDCIGKQYRLQISTANTKNLQFLIVDLNKLEFIGERVKLTCGIQKPRAVRVTYRPVTEKAPAAPGLTGQVTSIEFPLK